MKTYKVPILLTIIMFVLLNNIQSQKAEIYYGKINTIMGNFEGQFKINLNDENKDMIEIKIAVIKQKKKGEKIIYKEVLKVNAAGIRSFEIDSTIYIVKNIELENNKTLQNCCLRITDSCSVATLAYWGTSLENDKCFVLTKNSSYYKTLKSISYFIYFTNFSKCETIKNKNIEEENKWNSDGLNRMKAYEALTQQELLERWKSRITAYKNCFSN
ncbi:MAG TPA: hypothetical protein PKG56_02775 [Chitinophagaceae bacterium]|nr:hypothetical protein [Chitinophagaceae bacterium]HMZ46817.1 hypothetical protein [Chitinophagaceae bacterium]HNF30068.1 hypothetical protein [Chitinophagaceae bacterium]HNL82291.1 hypothetical protein [Chitinophagaceae bacterium]HNM35325.1 hypothetical protein [Chitinophagaceae bacterium]